MKFVKVHPNCLNSQEVYLIFFLGEMSAGHQRLDQVMESGLPVVLAPGCVDMANFSNLGRVPEVFKSVAPILVGGEGGLIKEEGLGEGGARVFLAWNSLVTLMLFFFYFYFFFFSFY